MPAKAEPATRCPVCLRKSRRDLDLTCELDFRMLIADSFFYCAVVKSQFIHNRLLTSQRLGAIWLFSSGTANSVYRFIRYQHKGSGPPPADRSRFITCCQP